MSPAAAPSRSRTVTDSPHRPRSAKPRRGPRQRCVGGLPCPDLGEVRVHQALACAAAEGELVRTWWVNREDHDETEGRPSYIATRIAAVKKRVDNLKLQYFGAFCRGRVERLEGRIEKTGRERGYRPSDKEMLEPTAQEVELIVHDGRDDTSGPFMGYIPSIIAAPVPSPPPTSVSARCSPCVRQCTGASPAGPN